ncbi:aldo/keto reductase [Ruania zhangjianzhongii]|uniref:aldo/keto reductase n=1 Tax=Ruania zhangjianzhongii TaxID=2603206 RepID=UPI0011CC4560|nr:aldo/keto reductase [Ruania zhangjianzhongii]
MAESTDVTTPVGETIALRDGTTMPAVGLGSLRMSPQQTDTTISSALRAGYRLIDTASVYGNEAAIGTAIRDSGIPREDLFLTTKVWNTDHGYTETLRAFEASRARLGVDYVDLYLIHWPVTPIDRMLRSWEALIELQQRGDVKSIGVSNFMVKHLQALIARFDELPVVNQVEYHPLFQQDELTGFQKESDIVIQAWAPLGKGGVLESPMVASLGEKYGVAPAQVVLKWHLMRGRAVIPKSTNANRLAMNIDLDFSMSEPDLAVVDAMNEDTRLGSHPDAPPTNGLPDQ